MDSKLKNFVIQVLRKGTFRWPAKYKSFEKVKLQVGQFSTGKPKFKYKCAICSELFLKKDVVADHIDPVVPVKGWSNGSDFDFNEYIERLFVDESGFQILCGPCHDSKTKEENSFRFVTKRKKKEKA